MAPVNFPPAKPSTTPATGTTPQAMGEKPPPPPPPKAANSSQDSWTFSPVRPQLPGINGNPPLWAQPGYLNGAAPKPNAAPQQAPAAPKPAPDPAANTYARKLGEIFNATPEAFAKGQLPSTGPISDQQKDKLADATKNYLLDAKIGTLAGPAADQVRAALANKGIDPRSVEGKSLKELGENVGEKIAGDVSQTVKKDPAIAGPLVAAGLAGAAGAAVTGGASIPKISGKVGPVTVSGEGNIKPGGKEWDAKVEAKGTVPLKNGAAVDLNGSASANNKGFDKATAGATYRGPIGKNGSITAGANVTVDKNHGVSAGASATIEPKKGGPKIVISGGGDKNQGNVQVGVGGEF